MHCALIQFFPFFFFLSSSPFAHPSAASASLLCQACRERIKGRQAKIAAFTQRMNLINQRGTPDQEEMTA
jgi:hypothetical protein